jgi:hypothetical protein
LVRSQVRPQNNFVFSHSLFFIFLSSNNVFSVASQMNILYTGCMARYYWFKANKSGYGWHPANWKGWTILILYFIFLIQSFLQINMLSHSVRDTLINFFPRFLLFTAILTIITYLKGESITWGEKGKNQHRIP